MTWKLFFEKWAEVLLQINSYYFSHEIFLTGQQIQDKHLNIIKRRYFVILGLCDCLWFFTLHFWKLMLWQCRKSGRAERSVHSYLLHLLHTLGIQSFFAFVFYRKALIECLVYWLRHTRCCMDRHNLTLNTLTLIEVNNSPSFTMFSLMSERFFVVWLMLDLFDVIEVWDGFWDVFAIFKKLSITV